MSCAAPPQATDLSRAKLLFQSGCYEQCKELLLDRRAKDPENSRILQKLGDVCFKMNQIKEAEEHYWNLIARKIDTLDASNAKSLFQFGQFLFDDNRLDEAAVFFEKCSEIHKSGAAHYYLGLIRDGRSDADGAIYHFKMASEIQSEVVRYHFQLAKCLQSNCRYEEAMKSYEKALELTDHRDAEILNDYSQFLYQCMGKRQLAQDFVQLASALNDLCLPGSELKSNESPKTKGSSEKLNDEKTSPRDVMDAKQYASDVSTVDTECDQTNVSDGNGDTKLCNDVRVTDGLETELQRNNAKYSSLKCIVYDFIAAIQYLPLEEFVCDHLHDLETLDIEDFVFVFGRRDRIKRFRAHFEKLQSIKIQIGLYIPRNDAEYRNLVIAALKRAHLHSYFELIEDSYSIHGIAQRLQLNDDEVLLVSDRGGYLCPQQCGLSLRDIECIEYNLGCDVEMYTTFKSDLTPSFLSRRNLSLYRDLRQECLRHHFATSQGVESLQAIKWITENPTESPFLKLWMEFAEKLMFAAYCSHSYRAWTALELTEIVLEVEPQDLELLSQRALLLNTIARREEAETAFRDCIAVSPSNPKRLVDFGYFLFKQKRGDEARNAFAQALRSNPVSTKANIGMGRMLDVLRRYKEAEYYYRKAIAIEPTHPMAHVRYGKFLFFAMDDLEGALHHYMEAERLRPESDQTYCFMSRIYRELGDVESSKQCLIKSLHLNPSNVEALDNYRRHFGDPRKLRLDPETSVLHRKLGSIAHDRVRLFDDVNEREFGIFWIHHSEFFLRPDSAEFDRYFFEFRRKGMATISTLFDIDAKVLSEHIGITNEEHVKLIMDCIDTHVIRPYEDFKNWLLNVVCDRQSGNELFASLLRRGAVYSFESFARNIRNEGKMYSILGSKQSTHARGLWHAFNEKVS